ncbi:hypothetical protein FB563_0439 [Streptomyces puniciscabiei]|uniref:Uncharacterized protein n=1 Tax=Streptomyces puniciscabiei TaxID=164348 RepID=A0A542U8Y2_9ACTN|nr:hypothetical protein [Streptomyces puniciscabiei]TQK95531.1 hypothetical protein FB563_0439 [Streptomyces puniciscabiei]
MKKSLKAVERRVVVQLVVSHACSLPLCVRLRHEPHWDAELAHLLPQG